MGLFAADTTVTVDLPFDPPHTAVIQKLSGWKLGRAQKAFFNELVADVQDRGGAQVQKDMEVLFAKDPNEAQAQVEAVKKDPLNGHDRITLIGLGVKSISSIPAWASLTPDARMDMVREQFDAEVVDFFATEVLKLTKPALFMDTEAAKATKREADAAASVA